MMPYHSDGTDIPAGRGLPALPRDGADIPAGRVCPPYHATVRR